MGNVKSTVKSQTDNHWKTEHTNHCTCLNLLRAKCDWLYIRLWGNESADFNIKDQKGGDHNHETQRETGQMTHTTPLFSFIWSEVLLPALLMWMTDLRDTDRLQNRGRCARWNIETPASVITDYTLAILHPDKENPPSLLGEETPSKYFQHHVLWNILELRYWTSVKCKHIVCLKLLQHLLSTVFMLMGWMFSFNSWTEETFETVECLGFKDPQ